MLYGQGTEKQLVWNIAFNHGNDKAHKTRFPECTLTWMPQIRLRNLIVIQLRLCSLPKHLNKVVFRLYLVDFSRKNSTIV